jgi:glycine cleavage system H protein
MPIVRGCDLPDALLYDLENLTWYEELGDGTVRVGMSSVAAARAGTLVAATPRPPGRKIEAGKSCATIESGKWVGPIRLMCAGEIVARNDALLDRPGLLNGDPYGQGWIIVLRPDDWAAAKAKLIPGTAVADAYEARMAADGFAGCAS